MSDEKFQAIMLCLIAANVVKDVWAQIVFNMMALAFAVIGAISFVAEVVK